METKEYFEKVMQDFNQKRRDRNIFCGLEPPGFSGDCMGGAFLGSNVINRVTLLPKFVLYLEAG